ncbi:MAG: lamin tail domain-containing protein [Crocinitomicaceae bacterium]|nr:lamin tail domain-containing protein [Crocinitomicaceae bacterium]
MKYFFATVFILTHSFFFAQISDDFTDGDFTTNPAWTGTSADYIVNGSNELQLNSTIASISYLSTPHGLATLDDKEWRIWTQQSFSPSGSNFGRIYLTSSSADLTTDPDGFYVQLGEGGSLDALRLFKCDGGIHTELITGTSALIASSFTIGIQVKRDNTGQWTLSVDPAGGESYVLEGTANDAINLLGTSFGVADVYTVSNSTNFYYDNIYVGDEIVDIIAPSLVSATAINANLIDVLFDEPLDQTSAELTSNYDIQPFLSATSATLDGSNPALVHIVPTFPLTNGMSYTLFSQNIEDLSGNVSSSESVNFMYLIAESPLPGDVVINEFMCDPSPQVGLTEVEYVEIVNRSSKIFNLQDWKLGDASSDGTIQAGWILPGEHIVLTSTANVDSFAVAVAVSSFPSLNNASDNIVLRDIAGVQIDSISYTDDWYQDPNKDGGGYSIERINPDDPCSDFSDWAASNDALGGTPGTVNSIYDNTPDTEAPGISQLVALTPNYVEVYFSEGMDSTSLANATITTNPSLTIQNNYVLGAYPDMLTLQFVENIAPTTTYSIELQNVGDCWLNMITINGIFALPETPEVGDVVINELLFNPLTGGGDWVEVYNNSNKLLDLYNWELANYDNDTIDNHKLVEEHFLLFPGDYAVFTEDTIHIVQNYPTYTGGRFIQMDLPTYSNGEGTVYLIAQNQVMDEVTYSEDWHFTLIDDMKGKSLERLDFNGLSNDHNNWHTAAEAIGFATPGQENSQYSPVTTNGDFSFENETISPDNDGFQDVLQVHYEMVEPGLVGTFTIYDDRGRKIAIVFESELLAASGTFTWDGVKEDNSKASIGTYVAVFEAFGIDGEVKFAKRKAFVVAGNL